MHTFYIRKCDTLPHSNTTHGATTYRVTQCDKSPKHYKWDPRRCSCNHRKAGKTKQIKEKDDKQKTQTKTADFGPNKSVITLNVSSPLYQLKGWILNHDPTMCVYKKLTPNTSTGGRMGTYHTDSIGNAGKTVWARETDSEPRKLQRQKGTSYTIRPQS
jgi:hypothetical protein